MPVFGFLRRFPVIIGLLSMVVILASAAVDAQDADSTAIPPLQMPGTPIAGVVGSQIVVYDALGNPSVYSLPVTAIRSYVWNADGSMIAAIGDTSESSQLFAIDVNAGTVTALQTGIPEIFPPTFLFDGSILVATRLDDAGDYSQGYVSRVQQIAPQEGAVAVDKGVFAWNASCGGEYPYPSEWLVWDETGLARSVLTFAVTPFGILHSTSCRGTGFGLFNLQTGVDQAIPNTEGLVVPSAISPDGAYVVAYQPAAGDPTPIHVLTKLDLASFALTPLIPTQAPDALTIDANGVLYYSVPTATTNLFEGMSREQHDLALMGLNIPPGGDDPIYRNTVSIYRFDPAAGALTTLIDSLDAYAIPRLEVLPSQLIMVSVVPNMDVLVQGFVSGTLQPGTLIAGPGADFSAVLPITVEAFPSAGGDIPLPVVQGLSRFTARPIGGGGG